MKSKNSLSSVRTKNSIVKTSTINPLNRLTHIFACTVFLFVSGTSWGQNAQRNFSRLQRSFLTAAVLLVFLLSAGSSWGQVTWVSSSSSSNSGTNSSNNPTFAVPAGTSQGNLLVVAIFTEKGSVVTYLLPSGWTQIRATNDESNFGLQTFYKVAGASESGSYVFTHNTSGLWSGSISRFTGVNPSNPIEVSAGGAGSSGNVTSPEITPTTNGTLVLSFHGRKNTTALTADVTTTQRHFYNSGNNAYSNLLSTFWGSMANSATTAITATGSTLDSRAAQQIAINPAAGSTVTSTFTSSGTFTVPNCVSSLTVEAWGGGGGGGNTSHNGYGTSRGGGGAGGSYARKANLVVTPSGVFTVTVGSGGTGGNVGGDSWFGATNTVLAKGGAAGVNGSKSSGNGGFGTTVGSIGDAGGVFAGGNGGNASSSGSGGGGGGAGSSGSGGNATGISAGAGSANNGGNGGSGVTNSLGLVNGNSGTNYGGGGSGSVSIQNPGTQRTGGSGGAGLVAVTYTLPNNPTITLTNTTASACFSASAQNVTLAYSTTTGCPNQYSIDFNSGITDVTDAVLSGSSITIALPANLAAGSYSGNLTVKNSTYGFVSSSYLITVTVNPPTPAQPGTITGTATQCPALTSQTYSITAVTNATTYNWTVPTGWSITAGAGTNSISVTTGASGQNDNISVTAQNSCGTSAARTLAVTVSPENTATLTSAAGTNAQTRCINTAITNITYETTGATGATFSELPAGVSGSWSSNVATISGTPTASGTFNYTVTLTGGCGSVSATGTITVNPLTTPTFTQVAAICSGGSLSALPTTSTNNIVGSWAPALNNTATTTYTFTPNAGQCASTATMTIDVNTLPTATITASSATTFCQGGSVVLTASSGSSYLWSNGATAQSITVSTAGSYTVTVTNASGCATTSAATSVTVTSLTIISTLSTGVNVWTGRISNDYNALANWSVYDGNNLVPANTLPAAATNVIIPAQQACIANSPSVLTNSVFANNITIETGANLSLGTGTINIHGNYTNNGTLIPENGTVVFNGLSGNQIITKNGGETFTNLTVNKNSGSVVLANLSNSPITITGALTLTKGLVQIGANDFIMGNLSSLNGGSELSYIQTSSTGSVKRTVSAASSSLFPIGKGTYNPIQLTKIGASHSFGARVIDQVTANGLDNGPISTGANAGRMWDITPAAGYNSSQPVTVSLFYKNFGNNSPYSINNHYNAGFSNSPADRRMFHFGGTWEDISDASFYTNSTDTLNGFVYCRQSGVSDFSPFTVSNFSAVLPIELVSFQANCTDDNTVSVSWSTASEHNTSHYVVEKSRDGQNWSVLGVTGAAVNSTELLNYEMIDVELSSEVVYYRLTQYDNDGQFEVFNVVALNCEINSTNTLTTYPNPSENNFYLNLFTDEMEGNGQIIVLDGNGRVVYTKSVLLQNGNNVILIDDMNAEPGIYYIKVSNETTTTYIVKHSLR
jgi:hypothetical protein